MIPAIENKYKIEQFSGDCNNIMKTSVFFAVNAINAPLPYGIITTKHVSEYCSVQDFADSGGGTRYTRTKTNGVWSEWEQITIMTKSIFLTEPLTKDNTVLTDNRIAQSRAVVVYYTTLLNGNRYIESTIVPHNLEWSIVERDSVIGFIRLDKNENQLVVSQYSEPGFGVLGYSIIM